MWGEHTLTQHRLSLNESVFCYFFYRFVFRFLPCKAALDPNALEMEELQGRVWEQPAGRVEEEGVWLMGAVWYIEHRQSSRPLLQPCMRLSMGERWFSDQASFLLAISVEERPWWKTQEEGKLYKYGWQARHLAALECHSHEAKLKDQYFSPHNPELGNQQSQVWGTDCI